MTERIMSLEEGAAHGWAAPEGAVCDWGGCDEPVAGYRFDAGGHGWLPVCAGHRGETAETEPALTVYWERSSRDGLDEPSTVIYETWADFQASHPYTARCLPTEAGASVEIKGSYYTSTFRAVDPLG